MDDIEMEAYRLLLDPAPPRDSRPPSKMKPNTRFLQHIVRNANSHNAALLARETADSQRRLKRLMRTRNDGPSASDDGDDGDAGDDDDRQSRKSRRRGREGDTSSHRRHHRHRSDRDDRDKSTRHTSHRSHRDTHSRSRERHERHRSSKHQRRSKSPEKACEGRLSPPDTHEYRDRSPRRKHRRHHDEKEATSLRSGRSGRDGKRERAQSRIDKTSKRAASAERSRSRSSSRSDSDRDSASSDSDPLDEFVGPRLASDSARSEKDRVRMRGRGAFSAAALGGLGSSIDRHFAADYDPSADVEMPADAKIDDAQTEMQRDRKQLLRDGVERLRAAGFTDKEIAIWSRGGRRGDAAKDAARPDEEAAAPWTKKGEAREWDRGKEEGDDGPARPIWAR